MLFPTLDKRSKALITKARLLGGKGPTVNLQDYELLRLCAVTAIDLSHSELTTTIASTEEIINGYYSLPLEWFNQQVSRSISFVDTFILLRQTNGRQVDCLEGTYAYEFKMRVTIAASNQGRFKEELAFALDCHSSNYTPILLVLDPTPSTRLDELITEYSKYGGRAFIGDDAWKHIEDKAGNTMGKFVEK